MTAQFYTLCEEALQACTDEDEVFAQTYVPEQSTRAALRLAVSALKAVLEDADIDRVCASCGDPNRVVLGEVTMRTAKFIKHIEGWTGDARLYELSEPIKYGWREDEKKETSHVIVSATVAPFSGPETYIFPSDPEGNVLDWGEMEGSLRGSLSHEEALDNAGWEVV